MPYKTEDEISLKKKKKKEESGFPAEKEILPQRTVQLPFCVKADSSKDEDEDDAARVGKTRHVKAKITGHTEGTDPLSKSMDQACSKKMAENKVKYSNQDYTCARTALEYYNEKHGTDYELVETLKSYRTILLGFWYHCNFTAQLKKKETESGLAPSPKLFFAELQKKYEMKCKTCVILQDDLDPSRSPKPVTVGGCGFCRGRLIHPVDGFEAGRPGYCGLKVLPGLFEGVASGEPFKDRGKKERKGRRDDSRRLSHRFFIVCTVAN